MNKMERKFGRYAIPNLMYYIVILYAVGVLVQMMAPAFYIQYLMLDARAILHGQIWRVVTFMIWPPSGSLFFNLIAIYLYYNLGMTLERVWGTFRFNVYFFMGVIGHVLAALLIYIITGQVYILNPKEIRRKQVFHSQMREAQKTAEKIGRHRCAVCGRTEEDDPNLVFRYCSKCEGDYEYCQDHLYTHKHVTKGGMDPRQANSNQEA